MCLQDKGHYPGDYVLNTNTPFDVNYQNIIWKH